MIPSIYRIFRILPEEAGKLLAFIALAAFLQAGLVVGIASSDALFLAYLGAEQLPYVYLMLPVVTIAYAPAYSILLSRLGIDKLFLITLLILILGGVCIALMFQFISEPPPVLIYGTKIYTGLWFVALYTLFWNYTDDYFAILDGKRLFGLISAGSALGAIMGAALVSGLSHFLTPGVMFFAWSAFALATLPILSWTRRHTKVDFGFDDAAVGTSSKEVIAAVLRTFRSSRFALSLTLICFLLVGLSGFLEFLSYGVFQQERNAAELASLLGNLYAIAAALTLLINLFCFSRIVGWIGVNNTALIVPLLFLAAFVFFQLNHGWIAALFAFYVCQSLFVAIEYNNINLLFNGLAANTRKQLRTFIEALGEPLATALTGLFLLTYASQVGHLGISLTGLIIAGVAVCIALFIRSDYAHSLAQNLREGWLDLSPSGFEQASQLSEVDRKILRYRALQGSYEERLLATELLWRFKDPSARSALLQFIHIAKVEDADRLHPIITHLLTDSDNTTFAEMLLWLESDPPCPPELMAEFLAIGAIPTRARKHWERSDAISDRALAAIARWHDPDLDEGHEAMQSIRQLLNEPGLSRQWALRAIGDLRHAPFGTVLLKWIHDDDPLTRNEALRAYAKLAPGISMLPKELLQCIEGARDTELRLLLTIVARVADTSAVIPILRLAGAFPVMEQQMLQDAIVGMGAKGTPGVVRILKDSTASYATRTIAARILQRIALPQLQSISSLLIKGELTVRDTQNAGERLNFALELLSLSGMLPDLHLIQTSLHQSNKRDRANAVETLQQNLSRRIFSRLQPLIEASTSPEPKAATS